jgi:hypothetical protein
MCESVMIYPKESEDRQTDRDTETLRERERERERESFQTISSKEIHSAEIFDISLSLLDSCFQAPM